MSRYDFEDSAAARRSRRTFLATTAIGAVSAVAGCTSTDNDDDAQDTTFDDYEPSFEHPDDVRIDESFSLTIDDLPPDETVDIRLQTTDANDITWSGRATFETGEGRIDLESDTPVESDVPDELDVPLPMGLIQFLAPDTAEHPYWPADEETMTVTAEVDGEELGSTTLTRYVLPPGGTHAAVDHDGLFGEYVEPPGDEPAPGVLVLHGMGGQPDIRTARQLAAHGFVAFALHYFGDDPFPERTLTEIPLEYVDAAIDWLRDHDRVAGSQIGIYGNQKGGELGLLVGSRHDDVGAVVSVNGLGLAWEGYEGEGAPEQSSWTLDGEPVPYVPHYQDLDTWREGANVAYETAFEEADEETLEEATIPVEQIDGPVLLVSGADGQIWPSAQLQDVALERLEHHGHPYEYDHLLYENTGNVIIFPYQPVAGRGVQYAGGTPRGVAEAESDYWPSVVETLRSVGEE